MLRDTEINNSILYLGREAGKYIMEDIKKASRSIKIVTPYASSDFIKEIRKKAENNVEVSLIISSDIGSKNLDKNGYEDRFKSLRELIHQARSTDHKLQNKRNKGLLYTKILFITASVIAVSGILCKYLFISLTALPLIYLVRKSFRKIKIYSYSYNTTINLRIIKSPYDGESMKFDNDKHLVHAKMYIIDDEVAYIGSINFTHSAFWYNYESRIKITDKNDIKRLIEEFDYLFSNDRLCCLSMSEKARFAGYKEPEN